MFQSSCAVERGLAYAGEAPEPHQRIVARRRETDMRKCSGMSPEPRRVGEASAVLVLPGANRSGTQVTWLDGPVTLHVDHREVEPDSFLAAVDRIEDPQPFSFENSRTRAVVAWRR